MQLKTKYNQNLIDYLERIKGCSQCKESPKVSVTYATKIKQDPLTNQPTTETETASLCTKHWNQLADKDTEWSNTQP